MLSDDIYFLQEDFKKFSKAISAKALKYTVRYNDATVIILTATQLSIHRGRLTFHSSSSILPRISAVVGMM